MISLILGLAAFMLYFLYDINSVTRQYRLPNLFFAVGTVLLGIATVLDLIVAFNAGCFSGALDYTLLLGACVCFAALIYCLFFALPFKETYAGKNSVRCVCSEGVYGLCRHPGILCFMGMEILMGLAALPCGMIFRGLLFSFLNLVYAYFQDRFSFPKMFSDYSDYQKKVPFLIPGRAAFRRIRKTLLRADKEEVEV